MLRNIMVLTLSAICLLLPQGAIAQCLDDSSGSLELKGTVKSVKYQPDDGGKAQECRVLVLDQQTCIRSGIIGGKRLVREVQLLPGSATEPLPATGRYAVSGSFAASPCRDIAMEVMLSSKSAPEPQPSSSSASRSKAGDPRTAPPPAGASKVVRLGYGGPEKVIVKPETWNSPVPKALLGVGLTPTRIEFYRDGTYPVFYVKEDVANVPLLRLQQTDPAAADRKAKAILKANSNGPFELVTDGDRFRYDATRAASERGFEVVFED